MSVGRRAPKIVLLGMLSVIPVGGVVWQVLHYLLGFSRLGFDVYYVESHARTPGMLMTREDDDSSAQAAAYICEQLQPFGLGDKWAFHALHDDGRCYGLSREQLRRLYRDAALIVNLHGGTVPLPEHAETGRLVYLETDPVQLQVELHDQVQATTDFLEPHVAFFTAGLNYGNPDCVLPWSQRFPFVPSPPPVVLDLWEQQPAAAECFTTIGNWRQQWREVRYLGETYTWSKHHEFRKVMDLPRRTGQRFELALSSCEDEDQRALEVAGWRVRPGLEVSRSSSAYRDYVQSSRAEFTVAKDQNIRLRTGWFSERSAMYLAAGRPVVTQDTAFGNALPTGEGLLSFTDVDSAAEAVEEVNRDYARHSRGAAEVARSHLDSDVVLASLLERVGVAVPHRPSRRTRSSCGPLPVPVLPAGAAPVATHLPSDLRQRAVPAVVAVAGAAYDITVVVPVSTDLVRTRGVLETMLAHSTEVSYEVVVVSAEDREVAKYLSVLAARNAHLRCVRAEAREEAAGGIAGRLVAVVLSEGLLVPPGWLLRLGDTVEEAGVVRLPLVCRCGRGRAAGVPLRPGSQPTWGELVRRCSAVAEHAAPVAGSAQLVHLCGTPVSASSRQDGRCAGGAGAHG